ncbi:unnamed protein product [Discosporangium mesarthrocarpum]
MSLAKLKEAFLASERFAVVGASANRAKFGNKVLRCYASQGKTVTPVNPREESIEEIKCVASLAELPKLQSTGVSVVTPPEFAVRLDRGRNLLWPSQVGRSVTDVQRARQSSGNLCEPYALFWGMDSCHAENQYPSVVSGDDAAIRHAAGGGFILL